MADYELFTDEHAKEPSRTYVAPKEAPPGRRPPATEVGLIGWLRNNLFRSMGDTIGTLVTVVVLALFFYELITWVLFRAQFEIVFLNLKELGAGPEFPSSEVWRIELAFYILAFLVMLSVGAWMRLKRWILALVAVIALALLLIPWLSQGVEEPPIYYYVDSVYENPQVNFVARDGEEINFTIDPLTSPDDFNFAEVEGYIGNDNQQPDTSVDAYTDAIRQVQQGQLDPAAYDLNLAVQVWSWASLTEDAISRLEERVTAGDFTQEQREFIASELERISSALRSSNLRQAEALQVLAEAVRSEEALSNSFADVQNTFGETAALDERLDALNSDLDTERLSLQNLSPSVDALSTLTTNFNVLLRNSRSLHESLSAESLDADTVQANVLSTQESLASTRSNIDTIQANFSTYQEDWSAEERNRLVERLNETAAALEAFNPAAAGNLESLANSIQSLDFPLVLAALDNIEAALLSLEESVNAVGEAGDDLQSAASELSTSLDAAISEVDDMVQSATPEFNSTASLLRASDDTAVRDAVNRPRSALNQYEGAGTLQIVVDRWTSELTEGQSERYTYQWEAPSDGWYTFTVVHDEENPGEQGIAWLEIRDLEVFYSTNLRTEQRVETFGEEPVLDCDTCGTSVNRTDLRYNGERSIAQWLSLQVAPYLVEVRLFFFIALAVAAVGYVLGFLARRLSSDKLLTRGIVALWVLGLILQFVVVRGIGGSDLLSPIDTSRLGGLFLTVMLSAIGIIASFPIGIVLALGRQSNLPVISLLCTLFIEVVRGVPLITLLFMGRLILPFMVEGAETVDLVIRMAIVLTLFTSAYLAEVVRGGLQIIPKGQLEAAKALGLNDVLSTTLIVLPQALRAVIPAIMGQFVSLLKDTSLLAYVGLFELTGAVGRLLADTQTGYTRYPREGYLYVGIIYFILCYILAAGSRRLEATGAGATRRSM